MEFSSTKDRVTQVLSSASILVGACTRTLIGVAVTLVLIILAQWLAWLWLWLAGRRSGKLPPGPVPFPLIGHPLLSFSHRSLALLARRYGPVLFLRYASSPTVVISSPDAARQVLSTHDSSFASRPPSEATRRLLYGGDKVAFSSPYGPEWRFTRKVYATHVLNARRIHDLHLPVVAHELRRLFHRLSATVMPKPSRRPGQPGSLPVNLTACFASLMENIICRITFREYASDIDVNQTSAVARHDKQNQKLNLANLIHQASPLLGGILITDIIPVLGFLDHSSKQAMDRWFSCMDTIMEAILRKREGELNIKEYGRHPDSGRKETVKRDILDVLLALDEPALSRDKMKAMMMELIGTGIDTNSTTLDWAMAEMLLHPRVLKKVQEEVDSVVGTERMVEAADLPNLEYTKAVVKETLRRHPAAPLMLAHFSMEACEIEVEPSSSSRRRRGGGEKHSYHVPPGTRVLVNAWAISNDPRTWEEPERFVPERFVAGGAQAEVDVRGQHFELIPFGSGRRMCPGMTLALGVLELTLASLAHWFEWEVHEPIDMRERLGIVVNREAPLYATPVKLRLSPHLIAATY